jgi:hypothetical protein
MLPKPQDAQTDMAASAVMGLSRSRPLWWSEQYEAAKRVIQYHAANVEPKNVVRGERPPVVLTLR